MPTLVPRFTGLTMAWKVVRSVSLLWLQEVPDSAFMMLNRPLALAAEFLQFGVKMYAKVTPMIFGVFVRSKVRLFVTILGVNLCSFVYGMQGVTEHFGVDIWRFLSSRKRQRVSSYWLMPYVIRAMSLPTAIIVSHPRTK